MSSYCVLIIIQQLKSLKFHSKENYFQTHAAGFVRLPYWRKARKYQRELHLIIRLKLDKTTGKRSWFIFQYGKGFIEMQLIYLIDIFEDNYNIVRDRFETDSVNVMKNRPLVAKKQRKFQYILAWLSLSENHENCH